MANKQPPNQSHRFPHLPAKPHPVEIFNPPGPPSPSQPYPQSNPSHIHAASPDANSRPPERLPPRSHQYGLHDFLVPPAAARQ